jgi:nucleotide-binding universal stress UspA family protein
MKILCPTDFSSRSHVAAQVALALAQRARGAVELLHVVSPRTTDPIALSTDAALIENELRRNAQSKLAEECDALSSGGVPVTSWLAEGDIEPSIRARAKASDADLIVMASHSQPAVARFILGGSIAERSVRRADRPVVLVPPGTEPRRPESGVGASMSVVAALDGRAATRGALDFVRSLRRQIRCDVTFLRLYWPIEEYERLGLTGARDLWQVDPEVAADLTRSVELEVGTLPGTGSSSIVVQPSWGDPASAIVEYACAKHCDLVVMGAESRRGLARITHIPVAKRVAHQAVGVPVAFVPPLATAADAAEIPALMTVLAPTDLSPSGNRAVAFAYSLLAPRGGVVELCYVHEHSPPLPPSPYARAEGRLSDTDRASLLSQLRALVPPDAEKLGISTHVTVIDGGKAGEAILHAAERVAVDAIVLGAHGRGAAYRALVGSVSAEVVRRAHRPVLVVPRPKELS